MTIHFVKEHKVHIIAFLAVGFFMGWLGFLLLKSPLSAQKEVVIEEGQSVYTIAGVLKEEGIIDSELAFTVYTLVTGNETKLQAGRYVFGPGTLIPSIINSMTSGLDGAGDMVITIPEGFNVFDIDRRLASFGLIQEGDFVAKYHNDDGQFFPDTYRFKREGETVESIAQKMKNHLNLKFKDKSLFLSTLVFNDVLIKASILEKEARREEDMRLVASVIENRLGIGMRLQIDATVSYGACLRDFRLQSLKYCDVSRVPVGAEIRIDGPYNSYTRSGLPPGPIANPGITAIQAVLNPIESDYFYYLSPRGGGDLIFSETAEEHVANRRRYLGL